MLVPLYTRALYPSLNCFQPDTLFVSVGPDQLHEYSAAGVLPKLQADTLDEAIKIVNDNPHGNGTALFTQSGRICTAVANSMLHCFAAC